MRKRIRWVVEPHADDAFLSLGGHISNWIKAGDQVVIVTVYSATRKRAEDARAYAMAMRADWLGLGLVEQGSMDEPHKDHTQATLDALADWLLDNFPRPDCIYVPLGILHGEHYTVRIAMDLLAADLGSFPRYYLDQPYASTQKNGTETLARMKGMCIESFLRPHARKYRHIPLFKDQAKFFYYNPKEKLENNIELILARNPHEPQSDF